jgi:hypothetical protein
MAILHSWFNGRKDADVHDPEPDELFGRAGQLIKGCPVGVDLRLEIELDDGKILNMPEIIEILMERKTELQSRPGRR